MFHQEVGVNPRLRTCVPTLPLCSRVLQSLWELLLRMILDALTENRGVQVEFYNRFQHAVEVRWRRRPFSCASSTRNAAFFSSSVPRRSCSSSTPGGTASPWTT